MVIRLSRILIDKLFNKISVNNIDKKEGRISDKDVSNKGVINKGDVINIIIKDKQKDNSGECVYENARKNKDIIIKKLDYPYLRYYISGDRIRNNFNNLKKFSPYIIHEKYELKALPHISNLQYNQKEGKTYFLIIDQPDEYKNIEVISDYFNEECRVHCRFISATESVYSFFRTHYIDIIDHLQREDKDITIENMRETIWSIGPRECSTFKPKLIKFFIELYNARKILDISSGWGDRLIGAMSCDIDSYDGFDPNPCLHKNYKKMMEFFKHDVVNKNAVYTIEELPFEEAELKQDYYDLVMTSPPYFTMEIYDDNPETNAKQSIVKMYEREGKEDGGSGGKGDGGSGSGSGDGERLWYNNYLKVWINKCYNALRKGGVIALNINQYKNQHYIYWLLDDMKSSKWTYLGIISHSKPDKKNPQPTFIWRKA
jgi:hypothetical protein